MASPSEYQSFEIHVRLTGHPETEIVLSAEIYDDEADPLISHSVAYSYDYLNQLISRTVDPDGIGEEEPVAEYFVHSGGQIILQLDQQGEVTHRLLWGPQTDLLLGDEVMDTETDTTDQLYWALGDHQNTVRDLAVRDLTTGEVSIAEHRDYSAFGKPLTEWAADTIFGSQGRLYDESTELYNHLNRWRDDLQWLSEDPIGFTAGDPNTRRITGNDPINATDPTGLADWHWPWDSRARWNPATTYKTWKSGLGQFLHDVEQGSGQFGDAVQIKAQPTVAQQELEHMLARAFHVPDAPGPADIPGRIKRGAISLLHTDPQDAVGLPLVLGAARLTQHISGTLSNLVHDNAEAAVKSQFAFIPGLAAGSTPLALPASIEHNMIASFMYLSDPEYATQLSEDDFELFLLKANRHTHIGQQRLLREFGQSIDSVTELHGEQAAPFVEFVVANALALSEFEAPLVQRQVTILRGTPSRVSPRSAIASEANGLDNSIIFREIKESPWKQKISGIAQKTDTPGHQFRSYREAISEARKANVTSVHLDHGYNRALRLKPGTISPNNRPDVLSLYDDQSLARIEVRSRSDVFRNLVDRNTALDAQIRAEGFRPLPPRVVDPTRSPIR